ncbi:MULTISPECIES: DUF2063 domain-containing protein [unclassified Methylophilus]|uniref:HvfC family RiPP maturation protein n=1 Tax=unclassified Methylophilus TaxID=2630143 RepID=UPI00036F9939|nr:MULTISPECIES: putative DNA-binding domain-containing protein [unclassified Methylophilus]
MPAFQAYQAAFTAHLRHPARHAKPAGVSDKRMRVYREIVFNNFEASVSACFPVLRDILGQRRFSKLVRQCFFSQQFNSPLFKDIPGSFVAFLHAEIPADLPAYTAQLAHYEWIELLLGQQVDAAPADSTVEHFTQGHALLHRVVQLCGVHQLLHYDYAVHLLSKKQNTVETIPTFLLVYRTPEFKVCFIQLNAITYQLLQQLQTQTATSHHHLLQLAQTIPHFSSEAVIEFGLETLLSLHQQQAITTDSLRSK